MQGTWKILQAVHPEVVLYARVTLLQYLMEMYKLAQELEFVVRNYPALFPATSVVALCILC